MIAFRTEGPWPDGPAMTEASPRRWMDISSLYKENPQPLATILLDQGQVAPLLIATTIRHHEAISRIRRSFCGHCQRHPRVAAMRWS